ncbi:hypothetical protein IRT45_31595 [Nocardia sp. BSTN01]|uniref:hypothetical protein n=1 Tax=Nocardia sp. BSTN01 TaxID=2783665 RepID=UPI00189079DE|nr:hypothetical protein [Nocardia sp. BSTN01]MBF5001675.1 hypothetical protein [Nocardia sp. BSTN01]
MTELGFDAVSGLAGARWADPGVDPAPTASTPLQRAAARLQAVLPPGWQVEIDLAAPRPHGDPQPVLRVRLSEN